jgi:hypothetical protein
MLERLVRRQHVVVRGHDRDRRLLLFAQLELVVGRERRERVREVRARQGAALDALDARRVEVREIGLARRPATLDDPIGHLLDYGMNRHDLSF